MTFNETIQAVLNASSNHKAEQLLFSTIHTVPERAVMFYALKSRLDIAAAKDEELANKLDADETFSPELLDEAMQNQLVLSRLHFLFGRLFRDMELYGEPPAEFGDLKEAPDRFLSLLLVPFAPLWKDGSVNTEKLKNLLADEGAQNIQKFVAYCRFKGNDFAVPVKVKDKRDCRFSPAKLFLYETAGKQMLIILKQSSNHGELLLS